MLVRYQIIMADKKRASRNMRLALHNRPCMLGRYSYNNMSNTVTN